MSKVLLVVDMSDEDYQLLEKYTKQNIMIVDIGYDYNKVSGWAFIRRKLLCAKLLPKEKDYQGFYAQGYSEYEARYCDGYNDCIDEILKEVEE